MASSVPWITSTGQRTSAHAASTSSLVPHSRFCTVAISVSAEVSSPQPTQSSNCFVEWGSVNICDMKNSTKPR